MLFFIFVYVFIFTVSIMKNFCTTLTPSQDHFQQALEAYSELDQLVRC